MANPGMVIKLPGAGLEKVCEVLLDHEVSFSVIGSGVHDGLIRKIYEITKSEYVRADTADYVIVAGGSSCGGIKSLNRGTLDFPDKGATVIYMVRELGNGGLTLGLKGPGIESIRDLTINGADAGDLMDIKEMNSEFPLGLDLVLIDDNGFASSIPRSSSIEFKG